MLQVYFHKFVNLKNMSLTIVLESLINIVCYNLVTKLNVIKNLNNISNFCLVYALC